MGAFLRFPKTTQERRANGRRLFLYIDDYKIKIRAKRNFSNLPNCYDDIHRCDVADRTWKRHRDSQYHLVDMFPTSFDESNAFLSKPEDLSDDQCVPLSVQSGLLQPDDLPIILSCWKMTKEEQEEIAKTGRVWLGVLGNSMPPVLVAGIKPVVT